MMANFWATVHWTYKDTLTAFFPIYFPPFFYKTSHEKWKKRHSPDFFKDVSFHVSFHVNFGNMRCCDFGINNPQNSCLVTRLLMRSITF